MSEIPPQPSSSNLELACKDFSQQKTKRLVQILRATQIALLLVALLSLAQGLYRDALAIIASGLLLFSVDWAAHRQRQVLGSWILLGILSLMLITLAWNGGGIRGSVPLAFSGILLYAALLGDRRQLLLFVAVAMATCLGIAYLNQAGLHVNLIPPTTLATGAVAAVVLAAIGFSASLLAEDYRQALAELERENQLVRNAKNHIEHLAMHDPLTNLPNRNMAQANFKHIYAQCRQGQQTLGIIYIDLDNLKPINDSLGHQAGDQILIEVAQRLRHYAQEEQRVCRYGGDEFILFLPGIHTADDASRASMEILQLISHTYTYRNIDIFCTGSIGIALAPQDGEDLDTLIKKADIAMYHSKDSGRNSFRFFNASISQNMLEHLGLISGMRKGLIDNQFSLHYQPKIDLHSNQICGFEALLRWQHPEQGYISPATFIPLAESSGLIIQLGEWVINEACRQAKLWLDRDILDFTLAINISSIQFKRGNIDNLLLNALASSGLPPQYLELELTESLLIEDSERLATTLTGLRNEGVHLSIDDFGTGYSNLGYLKKFEVEALKIDQSFVRKMDDHSGDAAIVRAIIQMASSLGLKTIAEGVEDASTAALLRNLGCTQAQGYHWARPMPAEEAEKFWREWQSRHPKT